MKNAIILVVLVIIGWFGFLYFKKDSIDESAAPVKIGTIMSETGVAAAFGEMSLKGAQMAVEEINADGGINGRKIVLVSDDDRSDPKTAAGLYAKQTGLDKVDAIIGSNFDFTVQPLFEVAKNGTTVVVTPTAARIPGSLETNQQSFSMLVDFDRIVAGLTKYMNEATYSKLGVIHYASGFGKQVNTTLSSIAKAQGKTSLEESYNAFGTVDWKPMILKFKKEDVDLVFLDMLADDMIRFMKDAKVLGYSPTVMTHNDIRNALTKVETDTSLLENVIVLDWDVLETPTFKSNFMKKFGVSPMNHASQSYAAVYVLTQALEDANKSTLAQVLESKSFSTPLGKIAFDKNHSAKDMPIKVRVIKQGKLVDLYSI